VSQKYDQLIGAGEVLFVKHGMRRVTVEEICGQANVSKPTFYKYFENKEALSRRIVEMWVEEALSLIDEIEQAALPFPEKLKRIMVVKQELSARPGPEFLGDLISLDIDLSYALQRMMRFLVMGQQNGDIRADIRPEILMASFNLLNSMQHDERIRGLYDDAGKLAADVFKLFYYGALSAKHREQGLSEPSDGPMSQE
jgi:AcrR family transcriptional regulator